MKSKKKFTSVLLVFVLLFNLIPSVFANNVDVLANNSENTIDSNAFANDLWLNSNYQRLTVGDNYQLKARRVPEIVENSVSSENIHPDYSYELIKGDSVELESTSKSILKVTALKVGVSIIKVTYAETEQFGETYPAISDVNTAYFIVDVVEDKAGEISLKTDINLRSYDTIYYLGDDGVDYSFDVETDADSFEVKCNNQLVEHDGNSATVNLENCANIIEINAKKDDKIKRLFYVIDAREIDIELKNLTHQGKAPRVGDELEVFFKGITPPVYKLATIYNPTWYQPDGKYKTTGTVVKYENSQLGTVRTADPKQYDLATDNALHFTVEKAGTYHFTNGQIESQWWGKPLGSDKDILESGNPDLNAPMHSDTFSVLPDFSFEVLDDAEKQTEEKQTEEKQTEEKQTEEKQTEEKQTEEKQTEEKQTEEKQTEEKQTEEKQTEENKPKEDAEKPDELIKVSLSIDLLTIDKGYVLKDTNYEINADSTVWQLLEKVCADNDIAIDSSYNKKYDSIYISAIAGIGEFDHGNGSGWKYNVNGDYPNKAANRYKLEDGDDVNWRYTTKLGKDLGDDTSYEPEADKKSDKDSSGSPSSSGGSSSDKDDKVDDNKTVNVPKKEQSKIETRPVNEQSEIKKIAIEDLSEFAAIQEVKVFADYENISDWAIKSLAQAIRLNVIRGNDKKELMPKKVLTRAEIATMFYNLMPERKGVIEPKVFTDVIADDWYYQPINAVVSWQLMQGMGENFEPNGELTREQLALIICHYLNDEGMDIEVKTPADIEDASAWAKKSVLRVYSLGLIKGDGENFAPKASVTREMAVTILLRAKEYLENKK